MKSISIVCYLFSATEVCDFTGRYNYKEEEKKKKKRQKEKSQVPAPRPLAREVKRDTARKANPEKMGRWVPEATTRVVRHG